MNRWLLGAIGLSMLLHCFILYVPAAALLFSVEPLDGEEWLAVVLLSFPVIIVDEALKAVSRWTHDSCLLFPRLEDSFLQDFCLADKSRLEMEVSGRQAKV